MESINTQVSVPREKLENYKKVKDGFSTAKAITLGIGTVATAVMLLIPADGPFGELIAALATGVAYGVVAAAEGIYDAVNKKDVEGLADSAHELEQKVVQIHEIQQRIAQAAEAKQTQGASIGRAA